LEVDLAAVEAAAAVSVVQEEEVVSVAAVVADRLEGPVADRLEDRPDEDVPREDEAAVVDTTTATVLRAVAAVEAARGEAIPMGPPRC
jgi:phosphohistidine swiveling domain-containing protein